MLSLWAMASMPEFGLQAMPVTMYDLAPCRARGSGWRCGALHAVTAATPTAHLHGRLGGEAVPPLASLIVHVHHSVCRHHRQRLGASRTRDVLKEFHTLVVEELVPRGGVVLNFMGDGAMVVFGLPEAGEGDATQALAASLAMITAVRGWIARTGAETRLGGVRLGAHYGPVILSRLGHDEEQHITATGDSVNVASRLMEVAKANGAGIAVSKALWDAADVAGLTPPESWEVVAIRGREEPMTVGLWR